MPKKRYQKPQRRKKKDSDWKMRQKLSDSDLLKKKPRKKDSDLKLRQKLSESDLLKRKPRKKDSNLKLHAKSSLSLQVQTVSSLRN